MPWYLTFLIVITVLISIELVLRALGSSLMILLTLFKNLNTFRLLHPKLFAVRSVSTFISLFFIVLGWCIIFKLPGAVDGYASFNNILFLIIFSISCLFGIVSFIWNKVSDSSNIPNRTDNEGANGSWLSYLLYYIPIWLFENDVGPNIFKVIIGIAISFFIIIGLITLLISFPALSKGIFIFLQIGLTITLLTFLYFWLENNPQFMELISNSFIFRFLYNIIFALPCLLYSMINGIHSEVKNTPKSVYVILFIEFIIISIYIASLFSKKLKEFIYDKIFLKKSDLYYAKQAALKDLLIKLQKKKDELNKLIIPYSTIDVLKDNFKEIYERLTIPKEKRNFIKPKTKPPLGLTTYNWEDIVQKELYLKNNENKLMDLLKKSGFKSKSDGKFNPKEDKDIDKTLSYIQTNGLNISKLIESISELQHNIKDITKSMNRTSKSSVTFKDPSANKIINGGDSYTIDDSKILLSEPQYLDKKINIGTFDNLNTESSLYNYQYGISSWVYLHEQPTNYRLSSTKFSSILDYASNPTISYNLEKHMFRITIKDNSSNDLENSNKIIYKTDRLPMQRWNNIVINFNGGTLDVFINGMLVSTTDNVIPYMKQDMIYTGERDGISGGICNVTYFSAPLKKREIENIYKYLKNKNPPII